MLELNSYSYCTILSFDNIDTPLLNQHFKRVFDLMHKYGYEHGKYVLSGLEVSV